MKYGIIDLNVIAVRSEKNAKSEMISQFFFGESVTILKKLKKWSYVESNLDNYKAVSYTHLTLPTTLQV